MSQYNISNVSPMYRRDGSIVADIRRGQAAPMMPRELSGIVSPDVWIQRVDDLAKHWVRFYGVADKVALIVAFVATVTLPWPLISLLERVVSQNESLNFIEFKLAALGIFLGVGLLFFGPVFAWKALGNHRLQKLLLRYKAQDAHRSFPACSQTWTVRAPVYSATLMQVVVSVPPPPGVIGSFHPDTYLPAYMPKFDLPAYAQQQQQGYAPPPGPPPPPGLIPLPIGRDLEKEEQGGLRI